MEKPPQGWLGLALQRYLRSGRFVHASESINGWGAVLESLLAVRLEACITTRSECVWDTLTYHFDFVNHSISRNHIPEVSYPAINAVLLFPEENMEKYMLRGYTLVLDLSKLFKELGGAVDKKIAGHDEILEQATRILSGDLGMAKLMIYSTVLTNDRTFIHEDDVVCWVTRDPGDSEKFIASPNTEEYNKILQGLLENQEDQVRSAYDEIKEKALQYYRDNDPDAARASKGRSKIKVFTPH